MSTFIYQNGVLHADTRKIVNFPGRHMLTTDFESKVHKDKWCYIAISGFEATPGILNQIKRAVTIVECCRAVTLAMQEVMKNAERKRGRADFMCDVATYEQKLIAAQTKILSTVPFLAVTRNFLYGSEGELAESKYCRDIKVQENNSVEVIGSAQHAARVLLLNGVPPKDIYPILRRGNAPTGETCEPFDVSKLQSLAAPWLCEKVWLHATFSIAGEIKDLSEDEKDTITDVYLMVQKMGKFRWNRNYPDAPAIEKIINGWRDKKHRETTEFKAYRKGFFK